MPYTFSANTQNLLYTGTTCSGTGLSIWVDLVVPDNEVSATSGKWCAACYTGLGAGVANTGGSIGFQNIGTTGVPIWEVDARRYYTTTNKIAVTASVAYTAGNRVQLCIADDGVAANGMDIYVNGSSIAVTTAGSGTPLGSGNYSLGFPTNAFFGATNSRKGAFYRLAIYNRKLTSTEVANLASGSVTPTSLSGLVQYQDYGKVALGIPVLVITAPIGSNTNIPNDLINTNWGPSVFMDMRGLVGAPSRYLMLGEMSDGNPNGIDQSTIPARVLASNLQGPWTVNPYSALMTFVGAPYNKEISPSHLEVDPDNPNGLLLWIHLGNNVGPRLTGMARCRDFTALSWTLDPLNPTFPQGQANTFDSYGTSDPRIIRIGSTIYCFYRGWAIGGSGIPGIGLATGTTPYNLVRNSTLAKIVAGTATWDGELLITMCVVRDPEGRMHGFVAGLKTTSTPNSGIGYYASDDNGVTWFSGPNNPIIAQSNTSGSYYRSALDDLVTLPHGDVIAIVFDGNNLVDNLTNGGAFRGILFGIIPYVVSSPTKYARFYYPTGTSYTDGSSSASLLNSSVFILAARIRPFQFNGASEYREIYTEAASSADGSAFQKIVYFRLAASGGNNGKLQGWFRSPSGNISTTFFSPTRIDDGEWHDVAFYRVDGTNWGLMVDGVIVSTTTSGAVNTDATTTYKAVGNWHPTTGNPSEPFRGTIQRVVTCTGGTLPTTPEGLASAVYKMLRNGVGYPGGTLSLDTNTLTTSSDVGLGTYVVEGLVPDPTINALATDSSTSSSDHTASVSVTIDNALGRKLVIAVTFLNASTGVTAITFNGSSMPLRQAIQQTVSGLSGAAIYYLENEDLPAAGTYNLDVTVDGSSGTVSITAQYWTYLRLGAPSSTGAASGTGTSISALLFATAPGCLMVDCLFNADSADDATPGSGQLEVTDFGSSGVGHRHATSRLISAASETLYPAWTSITNATQHIQVAVVWRPYYPLPTPVRYESYSTSPFLS